MLKTPLRVTETPCYSLKYVRKSTQRRPVVASHDCGPWLAVEGLPIEAPVHALVLNMGPPRITSKKINNFTNKSHVSQYY
jgi:hypothetical protein